MSDIPYKVTLALPVSATDELFRLDDYFDPHLIPDHQRKSARTTSFPQGLEFLIRIGDEILRPYWGSCRYLRAKRGWQDTKPVPHLAGEIIEEVQHDG